MARRVTVIGFVLLALVAVGLLLTYIPKARLNANFVGSQNNLRELGIFAAHHANPDPKRDASKLPNEIPAATIFLADTPPDLRLSWVVGVLPGLDQRKQSTAELITQIDKTKAWLAEPNQKAGSTRLVTLLCPENPPEAPAGAAITCYVAVGGLGADAPSLSVGAPRAGAFRYDSPTSFARITDGLGQTLLFAETRHEVGPWLRGGYATTRGLNDAADAPPLVGGQFGGYFPNGANFAMCDGSVRTFSPRTTPKVLFDLATIAGKETDPRPGE
jgi:prepilin-type processing-associated H-X9-DG protein